MLLRAEPQLGLPEEADRAACRTDPRLDRWGGALVGRASRGPARDGGRSVVGALAEGIGFAQPRPWLARRDYSRRLMSSQYVFTMYKLSRVHPPDKEVLSDISLSFLPGAKIGVLGLNGSGKSHAAADHGRAGHRLSRRGAARARRERRAAGAGAAPGRVQGRARQRRGRSRRAARPARALQRAGGELLRGDRRRVRAAAGADRRRGRLEPRSDDRPGDGRAALPARRRGRLDAVRRRASSRGAGAATAVEARPAAARRADQPPRRRVGRRGWSATSPSTRARSSPSPTIATSSTTSPAGSSSSTAATGCRSRATTAPGSSRSRSAWPTRSARRARASARSPRSWSGCARTRRGGARRPRRA